MKNIRLQLDEDAANLLKAVSRLRGQTMGGIVHLLVMDACGGQSPEVARLKSQLAGMYEAVTAPYVTEEWLEKRANNVRLDEEVLGLLDDEEGEE